jgi:sterol desaturase/sphingolipid hydroxylase (fatty acid hydroxylase superfamily)
MSLSAYLLAFLIPAALAALAIVFCAALEKRWRADSSLPSSRNLNLFIGATNVFVSEVLPAPLGLLTMLGVNAAGGGIIELPSSGAGLLISIPVFIIVMDFGEYVLHRASHAIPFLWSLHSLHHNDTTYNATTAIRHHWLSQVIKSLITFPIIGLLFQITPPLMLAYTLVACYNYFTHANARINFGRFSWLLNSPAYHRRHHSALPEHYNSNYAALFPIFDVLTASYRVPESNEYPPTGLDAEEPVSLWSAIIWPIRKMFGRRTDIAQET